jgi:hypothetical protein
MEKYFRQILCSFLCALSFSVSTSVIAQDHSEPSVFNSDWLGTFEGDLKIYNKDGLVQEIPMKLIHKEETDSTFQWAIQYGENEGGLRDYTLKVESADNRHFYVDENNSILLDEYQYANKFLSWYEVANNLIFVSYTLDNPYLIFEVVAGPGTPVRISGNTMQGEDEIPEVKSFGISAYQRAILKRIE